MIGSEIEMSLGSRRSLINTPLQRGALWSADFRTVSTVLLSSKSETVKTVSTDRRPRTQLKLGVNEKTLSWRSPGNPNCKLPYPLLRRQNMSSPTAATRIPPFTISWVKSGMFLSDIPLSRLAINSAPRHAPKTLPRPPIKLAPPMTQAAIASSSRSTPASGEPLPTRAV